jgi:hypothetical protein
VSVTELAAGSAIEVLIARRHPKAVIDRGDDFRQRPAIGGFASRRAARAELTRAESGYVVPPFPDRRGRWWLVPIERAYSSAAPGYLQPGAWSSWGAPRWVASA